MFRAISAYRCLTGVRSNGISRRLLCSGKKDDDGKNNEFEDEFEEMSFNIGAEEDDESTLQMDETPSDSGDITPELASEMVSRMVAAAAKTPTGPHRLSNNVLSSITPHTISVLRASRITTNAVYMPGSILEDFPINRKVVATIDVPQLNLSAPANEALKLLAGKRYKDDRILISCNKFRTSVENQAYAISRLDKLVRAAKDAVGDDVDDRELESWEDVKDEVSEQLAEEDAANLGYLMSKKVVPSETVSCPPPPSLELN